MLRIYWLPIKVQNLRSLQNQFFLAVKELPMRRAREMQGKM